MKTNICLISSLRQPFRSLLLLILFGLISFGFITNAVEFILVQRETGVLGSYYRSIGVLENIKDPQSGDISVGIALIKTSPYFAYGDQREIVSGVMPQTYNENFLLCNCTTTMNAYPEEYWPNVHNTDIWFVGDLIAKEEVKTSAKLPENKRTVGYYLKFNADPLFAAYPEYATQGSTVALLFIFKGHESAIPSIQAMEVGQRYFIRGWNDLIQWDFSWENTYIAYLEVKPLDDGQLWYIPLAQGASIDFSDPTIAPFKNEIDVLNENLHTLGIIATADMSAIPRMQEASRYHYLTAGRWLNHQDDLAENKVIVVPESFAQLRGLKLGDEITFTFRPLTDTYYGLIRDGMDSHNWRSYPTYQNTFEIVGLYASTVFAYYAYIPTNSLRLGFASSMQDQFTYENDYSFVLDSSRHETEFVQAYKEPLQELGISLTFLPNNGPAYWAAVDPIRHSLFAHLLVFGLLMVVALILAAFLYVMGHRRSYAILRALGVPTKQANHQAIWPLLLLGELGIFLGGLPAWNYALDQAKASLSTIPTPAGVAPSADLSPLTLIGLCAAIFLLLALFTWLGVFSLSRKPVYELLQGETSQFRGGQKRTRDNTLNQPLPTSSSRSLASTVDKVGSTRQEAPVDRVNLVLRRKYTPASLSEYVIHHILRSRLKSILTLAIGMGFLLAAGWIRQTMERSKLEVDRLYDTTVVEADIIRADPSAGSSGEIPGAGTGFVYLNTVNSVLDSGFVTSSVLEADTVWSKIVKLDSQDEYPGYFPVHAYDSPETFYSGLADPGSLSFAPGWDMERFAAPLGLGDIQNKGVAALFPASLLEQLQLNVGETVRITDQTGHRYSCVIVGQYTGNNILIPISVLEVMDGSKTKFTVAHFSLDPKRNRELPQLHAKMEEPMKVYGGAVRFIVWDEELRIVIAQLEKNMSLLRVLYPVVIAVSVLIGSGLCFLLLLQATREAAIMRVLGTTKTAVRLALLIEPFFLSILGVSLGLGIAYFMWTTSDLVPLLISAGLYLAGVLAGSVFGVISVTNKKPIELLQVKE